MIVKVTTITAMRKLPIEARAPVPLQRVELLPIWLNVTERQSFRQRIGVGGPDHVTLSIISLFAHDLAWALTLAVNQPLTILAIAIL
jgi:hypothetical protein